MKKIKKLLDVYAFPGFRPLTAVKGIFGDNKARIVTLKRLQKKLSAVVAALHIKHSMIVRSDGSGIYPAVMSESILKLKCGVLTV